MPAISVIVPVYQAEALLPQCVESVLAQTFSDWELLLIDDGSRDGSPTLCDGYAARDPRIRVFHKPNGGVSTARNLGLEQATGPYIAFLDADDTFEPAALETLWYLREKAGADSAGCAHYNVTPDGEQRTELLLPAGIYEETGIREKILWPLAGDRLQPPVFNGFIWRFLFDAAILRDNAITFEGAYLEDELFLMEYFANVHRLAVTDKPLYRYLENPASATHRYMRDYPAVFARFLERKAEIVEKYGLDAARPQWRANTVWAGLLIAVGNEYVKSNPKPVREKRKAVEALCAQPEFAKAIRELRPKGLGRNKQIVAGPPSVGCADSSPRGRAKLIGADVPSGPGNGRRGRAYAPTVGVTRDSRQPAAGNGRGHNFLLQMGKNVVYCQLSHLCEKYEFARWAHGRRKAHSGQAEKSPDLWHGPGGRAGTDRDSQGGPAVLRHTARGHGAGAGQRRKRPGAVQARGAGPGGPANFRRYGKE